MQVNLIRILQMRKKTCHQACSTTMMSHWSEMEINCQVGHYYVGSYWFLKLKDFPKRIK